MAQRQPGQSKTKGNPAGKRMSNEALRRRRAASWGRGERRTADRRNAQDARATSNRETRKLRAELQHDGDYAGAAEFLTPWEDACARRRSRRLARFGGATWLPDPVDEET